MNIAASRAKQMHLFSHSQHLGRTETLCNFHSLSINPLVSLEEYTRELFPYPAWQPASPQIQAYPTLHKFVDSIMRQTRTQLSVLCLALFYLRRLKSVHPSCRGSPGASHRLLYTSIIIASKFSADDTYDNKAWSTATLGLFSVEETNKMEREFLQYLEFNIFVRVPEWSSFLDVFGSRVKQITSYQKQYNPIVDCEFIEYISTHHGFGNMNGGMNGNMNGGLNRRVSSSSTFYQEDESNAF